MIDAPKYEHNCGKCVFLEHYEGADLYFHLHVGSGRVTLKARFGDGPAHFESWGGEMPPPEDWYNADHLIRAYNFSKERGLFDALYKWDEKKNVRGKLFERRKTKA